MRKYMRAVMAIALAGGMGMLAGRADAATYYWDTDGNTNGFGDTAGTWGTSDFWSSDSTGASGTSNTTITTSDGINFGTDTLALGSAAAAVGVFGAVTVNSITFGSAQTPPVTLSGGTSITLGGTSPAITVNNATNTISSLLAGSSFTKAGDGTLTLSGANTHSGTTTIGAGTLRLQGASPLNTGRTYTINGGAVMNLNGGAIFNTSVAGNSTINGTGTLSLSGGHYTRSNGGGGTLTASLGAGGLIDIQSGVSVFTWWGSVLTFTGNQATLNVNGTIDGNNALTINADALTGAGTIKNNPTTLNIGVNNGSGTFSGTIQSSASLTKTGAGTQTLSGNNTYSGGTTVSAGTLLVNGSITGTVSVASGAYLGGTGAITGNVTYANGAFGLFTNDAPLRFTGPVTLNGNTVHLTLSDDLAEGTYLLATNTSSGFSGTFSATPVIDSGSVVTNCAIATDSSAVRLIVSATDTIAPSPDPMTFTVNPWALNTSTVVMTATTATDAFSLPVEYFFTNTFNGNTSGWILSTVWTNTGLMGGITYGYQVKARDAVQNETGFSGILYTAPAPRTLYWDGGTMDIGTDGNGSSAGGSGTWNTSLLNWDAGAAPHVAWSATQDTAVFGGTAGTVTLGSDIQASGLTFNVSGYTIGGAYTLTLGANNSILVNVASPGRTIGFADGLTVANVSQVQVGSGNSLANNALTLTNGTRMSVANDTYIGYTTGGTGSRDNTLTIMGGSADSVYNAGNKNVIVGYGNGGLAAGNQLVIGTGGSITNVASIEIGKAQLTTSANAANRNAIRVAGGKLFAAGSIRVGMSAGDNPCTPARTNALIVAAGGVVNATGGLYIGVTGYNFQDNGDNTVAGNSLTVTNGGFLSTKADCYIGSDADNLYQGNPAWKGTALGNIATVGGSLNGTNAMWNLGGQKLYVGYAGYASSIAMYNSLTAGKGGVVTNISTLTVRVENTVALAPGGNIYATAATINGTLSVSTDDAVTPSCGHLAVSGNLNITNATLNLVMPPKPLPGAVYIFGKYGSLPGSFKGTNGLPENCSIDMNYNSLKQIALIVPPPSGMVILIR